MQPGQDQYKKLDDKPYDSLFLYVETVIDHPVEKIWPHAVNIKSWMDTHAIETLSGETGKVGHFEKVRPHGIAAEVPRPHHHLYGISALIPHKLIVLEVFPENGGSYGTKDWVSFDSILFSDLGGRTRVTFHMIDMHMHKADPASLQARQQQMEGGRATMNKHFENLRRLVAGGK